MKKKRHTPEQIIRKLREADAMLSSGVMACKRSSVPARTAPAVLGNQRAGGRDPEHIVYLTQELVRRAHHRQRAWQQREDVAATVRRHGRGHPWRKRSPRWRRHGRSAPNTPYRSRR